MIELFDRQGRATAFYDGQTIYFWDGRPAAYFLDDRVSAFSGRFIGWFTDGSLIRRGSAYCLNPTLFVVRGSQPGKLNPPQASAGLGPSEERSSQLHHVLTEPPSGRTEFSPIWFECRRNPGAG